MPLADRDGRKDVQEFVEDLRGGLRCTLRESLTHEVGSGCGERAGSAGFGNRAERTDRERRAENAQIVVVDLVAETGVADLVEPLEWSRLAEYPSGMTRR